MPCANTPLNGLPYDVPRIVRALQLSGIPWQLYALAAGLIVPPVPFFPGNWLNTDTFTRYLFVHLSSSGR